MVSTRSRKGKPLATAGGKVKKAAVEENTEAAPSKVHVPAVDATADVDDLKKEIWALEKQIKDSDVFLNNVLPLLELCSRGDSDEVHVVAIRALLRVVQCLAKKDINYGRAMSLSWEETKALPVADTPAKKKQKLQSGEAAEAAATAEEELLGWLNGKYLAFLDILEELLQHESAALQVVAVDILSKLMVHETAIKKASGILEGSGSELLARVIRCLIIGKDAAVKDEDEVLESLLSASPLLEHVREVWLHHDDVRFFAMKAIKTLLQKAKKTLSGPPLTLVMYNAFEILHSFRVPHKLSSFMLVEPPAHFKGTSKKQRHNKRKRDTEATDVTAHFDVFNLNAHKRAFQAAWMAFLALPLTPGLYKRVLTDMPGRILPSMPKPQLAMDFLSSSYDVGGIVSLLSLNGLFILITKYNLDYPKFFEKLYRLLTPQIFYVKHSEHFFKQCRLFLASNYLPEYLCAAFCKRLMRLALRVPSPNFLPALPIIHMLLTKHASLSTLVHKSVESSGPLMIAADVDPNVGVDPFVMEEEKPEDSHAAESSLYELTALRKHYIPTINRVCKVFEKPIAKKRVYDMNDFVGHSFHTEFMAQLNRQKNKPAPMRAKHAPGLFTKAERKAEYAMFDV